jgi:cytochrome c peroxidase
MDFAIFDVLQLGGVAIVGALLVLLLMVHFELGPLAGLARRRRWLLMLALGSGVMTFSLKLGLVVWLTDHPPAATPGSPSLAAGTHKSPPVTESRYRWQAMSESDVGDSESGYRWETLPQMPPLTASQKAQVALGKRLFFETALSRDRSLSCASCHDIEAGAGDDGRATAMGIDAKVGPRNTPTVWNAAYQTRLFWDGRAASLEQQALGPLLNPIEMGMPSSDAVTERVAAIADYRPQFAQAFGDPSISAQRIATALAAYERTLVTADSPYDRFLRGDLQALSAAQLRGMALFESVGCVNCHSGPNFSAASRFGSVGGSPWRAFPSISTPYEARYRLTEDAGAAGKGGGRGVWRVPSLRNVALTGPYFHNGSVDELEEAVRVMAAVQLGRTGPMLVWSTAENRFRRREINRLGEQQVKDIAAFLRALSSDRLVARISAAKRDKGLRYAAQ